MSGRKLFAAAGGALLTCTALSQQNPWPQTDPVAAVTSQRPSRPDIVLVLTDDQRRGLLDAMPAVRRLLGTLGTRYENAVIPTAMCAPSRSSLLTGRFAHSTGVWHNDSPASRRATGVVGGYRAFVNNGNNSRTVARALDSVGYHTALVGKYLNGYRYSYGTPPGWDQFIALGPGMASHYDYFLDGRRYGHRPSDYATDVISRRASGVIRSAPRSAPLFMLVAPNSPHAPYEPAPRDRDAPVASMIHQSDFGAFNEPDVSDKPHWVQRLAPANPSVHYRIARRQHRMAMSVDDLVVRIVSALKERGTLRNTMFIFMSDNGLHWGEHRLDSKNDPYDAATRVPLLVRWDGHVQAGVVSARLVSNLDVTATIADAGNAPMPWGRGVTLLKPTIRTGTLLESSTSEPFTSSGVHRPAYCGWRTGSRLFVRYDTEEEELYLLGVDPFEEQNVAGVPAYAEILRTMRAKAKTHCVPRPPNFSWTH